MNVFVEAEGWIKKARDAWGDANVLTDYCKKRELYKNTPPKLTSPVTQIYYSTFYCATALLVLEGLRFKKHSAVKAEFGRVIVKQKSFPKKYGKFLSEMFEFRQRSDYTISPTLFKREELKIFLRTSSNFIQTTQNYIDRMKLSNEN